MSFKIQKESFIDNIYQLEPLFDDHYIEVSRHYQHAIPLEPDYDRYAEFEKADALVFLTLRYEGALAGYFNGVITRSLHYKSCLQFTTDLLYVSIPYRGNRKGLNGADLLIEKAKEIGKDRGCKVFDCNFKFARAIHMQKLLERQGFEPFEAHWTYWYD